MQLFVTPFQFSSCPLPLAKNPHFLFIRNCGFYDKTVNCFGTLIFNLPPFVIHVIIVLVDQFRNRHKNIPLIFQRGNEDIQRLGCKFRSVMAKDNTAVSKMLVLCLSYFVVVSLPRAS